MDERHHYQCDAMLRSDQRTPMPVVSVFNGQNPQQCIAPLMHVGGAAHTPPPQPWTQTDALLSEVLRVLHGLRADIEAMNETLRKMRAERQARVVAFPATSLRNGTPR